MPSRLCCHSSRRPSYKRAAGGTAVELMLVVSIVAVLAALALPSFREMLQRYRVGAAAEDLTQTLYFARTEAIKRGGQVTVGQRAPAAQCSATQVREWQCGWHVFHDIDENGRYDNAQGETVLQSSIAYPALVILLRGRNALVFNRWGGFNGIAAASFGVRPNDNPEPAAARALCLSSGGRIRAVRGSFKCQD